jgi:hypothetical protein
MQSLSSGEYSYNRVACAKVSQLSNPGTGLQEWYCMSKRRGSDSKTGVFTRQLHEPEIRMLAGDCREHVVLNEGRCPAFAKRKHLLINCCFCLL